MQGLHLTADLSDCRCDPAWLTDATRLGAFCRHAVAEVGLQAVGELFHTFTPSTDSADGPAGVTATLLLAESHLCVHTWPELGAVTLDVYVCNFGGDHSARAQELMQRLQDLFQPGHVQAHRLMRGLPVSVPEPT